MKVQSIAPVKMVAVNEVAVTNWKHKEDTPIDFQQLLMQVISKDEEKNSDKDGIRIVTSRKESGGTGNVNSDSTYTYNVNTDKNTDGVNAGNSSSQSVDKPSDKKYTKCLDNQGNYNPETNYDGYFEAASEKYGVSVDLLKSVAKVESEFKPTVVSSSGAVGIMQLMPSTASSMGVSDSYDPEQNIMGGAKLLSILLEQFDGDVSLALAGYNAGAGAVERAGGVPDCAKDYVDKVLGYYYG